MEEQLRNPSPSLGERIESAKRRAHQVRVKIQQDLVREKSPLLTVCLTFCLMELNEQEADIYEVSN